MEHNNLDSLITIPFKYSLPDDYNLELEKEDIKKEIEFILQTISNTGEYENPKIKKFIFEQQKLEKLFKENKINKSNIIYSRFILSYESLDEEDKKKYEKIYKYYFKRYIIEKIILNLSVKNFNNDIEGIDNNNLYKNNVIYYINNLKIKNIGISLDDILEKASDENEKSIFKEKLKNIL